MEINGNKTPKQFIETPFESSTTTNYTTPNEQITSNTSDLEEFDQNHINFNEEHNLIEDEEQDHQNSYNTTRQNHSLNSGPKTIKGMIMFFVIFITLYIQMFVYGL